MITYGDIVKIIKKSASTQLVALFCVIVEGCVRRSCFQPGGMNRTIAKIENRIAKEKDKDVPNPEVGLKIVELTCSKCFSSYTLDANCIHRTCGLNGCDGKLHRL